jgi:hypothetical protein
VSDDASIRTPTYRVPRTRGMDPATKRLALIAAGLGSALLAVIGVWTVTGHRGSVGGSVPVIEPPPGPMRVKPVNRGGMQLGAGDELFAQDSGGDNGADKLAPPPEIPDPQALRAPPKPAAHPPAPQPAPTPALALPPAAPVAIAAPVPTAVAPAAAPTPQKSTPPVGPVAVQLAALPTQEGAKQQWTLLQHRLPVLLNGRDPAISKVEVDGHTWWRLRIGSFAQPAAARGFCDQVRAKGGACDVVPP